LRCREGVAAPPTSLPRFSENCKVSDFFSMCRPFGRFREVLSPLRTTACTATPMGVGTRPCAHSSARPLEARAIAKVLYPHNLLFRLWATDYERSDVMASVIDDVLFEGKLPKFSDLGPPERLPRIYINAASFFARQGGAAQGRFVC
jgi:hypothetical protein